MWSEPFEGGGRALHLQAQVGHEDEVGMGAEADQTVAIERHERRAAFLPETDLGHGCLAIGHEPRAIRGLRFQTEETAVQRIRVGRREEVVRVVHRTAHVTIALPWCHEGS